MSALGKEAVVVYTQTEMQKLQSDDGTDLKFNKFSSAVPVLCAFAEKGWSLKTKYEENRAGNVTTIYLMERKK